MSCRPASSGWEERKAHIVTRDPAASGCQCVDRDSLSFNLASQLVGLFSRGIKDIFDKGAAKGGTAGGHGNCFDNDDFADQRSCCGVVVQGKMVDLVSEVPGLLPHAKTEILLRRRTRAGIQNFGLIA